MKFCHLLRFSSANRSIKKGQNRTIRLYSMVVIDRRIFETNKHMMKNHQWPVYFHWFTIVIEKSSAAFWNISFSVFLVSIWVLKFYLSKFHSHACKRLFEVWQWWKCAWRSPHIAHSELMVVVLVVWFGSTIATFNTHSHIDVTTKERKEK